MFCFLKPITGSRTCPKQSQTLLCPPQTFLFFGVSSFQILLHSAFRCHPSELTCACSHLTVSAWICFSSANPDLSLCTLLTLTIHLSHWLNLACFFVWAWGHFLFLIQTLFCLSVSICLCLSLDLPMTPPTLHPPKNPLSFSLSIRSTFKTKKCLDKLRLLKRKVSFYNK